MKRGHLLRALGVAGMAGVAAGGVVVARQQRQRAAMTPEQVRDRLRSRHADAARPDQGAAIDQGEAGETSGHE